jgi:hypothetical protein
MPDIITPGMPVSMDRLKSIYMGNPNMTPQQVESDMWMKSSRGLDYIHKQAAAQGINDPARHFENMRANALAQNTPSMWEQAQNNSMARSAAYQQAETPNLLPPSDDPEIRRLRMAQRMRMTGEAEQEGLRQKSLENNPILDDSVATLQRRAYDNKPARALIQSGYGRYSGDEILRDSRFQALAQTDPTKADETFNIITGGGMKQHLAATRMSPDTLKKNATYAREQFEKGAMKLGPNGELLSRQLVPSKDPTKMGQLELSDDYMPLNDFQKSQMTDEVLTSALGPEAAEAMKRKRLAFLESQDQAAMAQPQAATAAPMRAPVTMHGVGSAIRESATPFNITDAMAVGRDTVVNSAQDLYSLGRTLTPTNIARGVVNMGGRFMQGLTGREAAPLAPTYTPPSPNYVPRSPAELERYRQTQLAASQIR